MLRSCIRLGLVALVGAVAVTAHADERRFRANDIRTLFAIAKNTNRNEVQYGVKLDDECQPVGNEPVYAYWRDFEKGPEVTDDLSAIERSLYGVREQRVLASAASPSSCGSVTASACRSRSRRSTARPRASSASSSTSRAS